jgi:hypothetical protein
MMILWYEVWSDESPGMPYLLVLCSTLEGYRIVDPREGNRVVLTTPGLEEARNFLLEDEYTRVDGRMDM